LEAKPRLLAMKPVAGGAVERTTRLLRSKLWLVVEMFCLLDETNRRAGLTGLPIPLPGMSADRREVAGAAARGP
jgi:hypothetical protein